MDEQLQEATGWNAAEHADYDRLKGKTVFSRDDQPIGTIAAVFHPDDEAPVIPEASPGHYFLVEQSGLTGPGGAGELYMPETAIRAVAGDRVVIAWTRAELENQGWADRPRLVERARRT